MIHKNTPAEELHDTIRLRDIMFSTSLVRLLVHTILQHHNLALSSLAQTNIYLSPNCRKTGGTSTGNFRTLSRIARNSGRIRKKLGITPLISRIKVIPEWEKRWNYCFPRKGKKRPARKALRESSILSIPNITTYNRRYNNPKMESHGRGKEYRFKTI